ncbi:unnamed protein product [Rotaria socialis]|uniref:CCHC-type domain-containing protein n=1 Tax=Rotaria socialis TaxID=392032 RepID=A0A821UCJ2_9BILA|nr:unnamed protein product [Rotaria socialis]CAF4887705.1 unnamed protein product [Rotaria socialis]
MTNNEETEQSPFKLPERTINLNENQYTTAQLVSNSLKLVNDDSFKPIHKPRNQQLQGIDQNNENTTDTTNVHPINSPARSIRRMHSDDLDDDFIRVTYKKKRNSNGGTHNSLHATTSNIHDQPSSSNVINAKGHSNSYQRTIVNSNLRQPQPKHTTNVSTQQDISSAATRYAQTRYPFPPFIIRFPLKNINDKHVAEEISLHFKQQHQLDLSFLNYRSSQAKCLENEQDVLLYVKDVESFTNLLDYKKWPITLDNNSFTVPSTPSIPPQLSLIIKNVDLRININEFTEHIKLQFPEVKNVIRLKNKMQQEIRYIKIEFISYLARNEMLKKGRINIDYRTYDIEEYLAPAGVLICSKCCGIGHFKRQCTQDAITCKLCGQTYTDVKQHTCTNVPKCVHCDGAHASNATNCPIVKQFRADLTKKLLHSNSTTTNNNQYSYDPNHFPALAPNRNSSIGWSNNNFISKLDLLVQSVNQVNDKINKLSSWHEKFENFMEEKNKNDEVIRRDVSILQNINKITEANIVQHDLKLKRHENILIKFIIPLLDEITKILSYQNYDQQGRVLDPDAKILFELNRAKLKCIIDGKEL